MPKVVVYVPAAAWRRLQERGLDPAAAVREFARRGYEFSDGPAPHLATIQPAGRTAADSQARDVERRTLDVEPVDDHFKPDFKKGKK